MTHENVPGTALGFTAGIVKGLYAVTFFAAAPSADIPTNFTMISWSIVGETTLLALIGGIVGWCGTELMRWIKGKVKNL